MTFHKGWFEDTLRAYRVPENEILVVALDADLYSSTRTVLAALQNQIRAGDYLYFDEFSDRLHERGHSTSSSGPAR